MGIFDSLTGGRQQIQNGSRIRRMSPMSMLAQLKRDPLSIIRQSNFNIPPNVKDPGDGSGYVQYLKETGQVDEFIISAIQNSVANRRR